MERAIYGLIISFKFDCFEGQWEDARLGILAAGEKSLSLLHLAKESENPDIQRNSLDLIKVMNNEMDREGLELMFCRITRKPQQMERLMTVLIGLCKTEIQLSKIKDDLKEIVSGATLDLQIKKGQLKTLNHLVSVRRKQLQNDGILLDNKIKQPRKTQKKTKPKRKIKR
jgi:hypothetical protein